MIRNEINPMFEYVLSKHHGHMVTLVVGDWASNKKHTGKLTYTPSLCKGTVSVSKYVSDKNVHMYDMTFPLESVHAVHIDYGYYLKIRIN